MNFSAQWYKRSSILKFLLANLVLSLLLLLVFVHGVIDDWSKFPAGLLWTFSICVSQWGGIQSIHAYIDKKISWIEKPVLKTTVQVLSFLGYSVSAFVLVQFFNFYIWLNVVPSVAWTSIYKSVPYTLAISGIISLIFTAIGFFKAWKNSFVQAEKFKNEMLAYKYESLRNQINPHFFFNSLNVLSDLVYDDQALAVKFIRQMSELFRYILDSRDKELVPLKEELDFIRSFTFLLKTRFENKLTIEINVESEPGDYIVPMALQLLIENAVKHNEISEKYPLKINVVKNGDYLDVENNYQPKKTGDDSTKTGLKNISQQLEFYSDNPIRIIMTDEKYLVRFPILKSIEK